MLFYVTAAFKGYRLMTSASSFKDAPCFNGNAPGCSTIQTKHNQAGTCVLKNTAGRSVVNAIIGLKIRWPHVGKIYIVGNQMNVVDNMKAN